MAKVENSLRKSVHKIVVYLIKTIPIFVSFLYITNTILSYFYINFTLFSFVGGVSLIFIILLYFCSITYRFCIYHRLFIHYITLNWLLDIIDYRFSVFTEKSYIIFFLVITAITLFLATYFKFRNK